LLSIYNKVYNISDAEIAEKRKQLNEHDKKTIIERGITP